MNYMTHTNKNSDISTKCQTPEQCVGPNLSVWGDKDGKLFVSGYYSKLLEELENLGGGEKKYVEKKYGIRWEKLLKSNNKLSCEAKKSLQYSKYVLIEIDELVKPEKVEATDPKPKLLKDILRKILSAMTTRNKNKLTDSETEKPKSKLLKDILEEILSACKAKEILDTKGEFPGFNLESPRAKDNEYLKSLREKDYELFDLMTTSFPNINNDDINNDDINNDDINNDDINNDNINNDNINNDDNISYCRRRCRLLKGPNVTLCVWETPKCDKTTKCDETTENWECSQQRWLHSQYNGIPRFIHGEYSHTYSMDIMAMVIIERIVRNHEEGLTLAFKNNLERLQVEMINIINKPKGLTTELEKIVIKHYELSKYIKMARENNKRLQEFIYMDNWESYLEYRNPDSSQDLIKIIEHTDEQISKEQDRLLKLAEFIPILQNEIVKSFRQYASIFAIIFSAIAIAVAVYGENLREVTLPNNGLTWWFSLGIVTIFSGIGYFGLKVWKKTNNWNLVSRLKDKVLDQLTGTN